MSERTRVRRRPDRGAYDRETINAILDEGLICHVGFVVDMQPFVIPTTYARAEDTLIVHGAAASRMLQHAVREGVRVCVTVTLHDGLVLAWSAFNHSMNYRSVVILGTATEITGTDQKLAALETIVEHVMPGRWNDIRHPTETELKATTVLAIPIIEASAKVRIGGPHENHDADYKLPVWAGEVPLRLAAGPPKAAAETPEGIREPQYVLQYCRNRS